MKKKQAPAITVNVISYFFILLFFYAGISKILDFENFQLQIGQSPLLTSFAGIIAFSVITVEIAVCCMLAVPATRRPGLYASLGLTSAFTVYIFIILHYSDYVPCSCGGVLEKMTWNQHLAFNILCVLLSVVAVFSEKGKTAQARPVAVPVFFSMVLPSVLVICLYFYSESIFRNENSFTRRYFPNALIETGRTTLHHPYYYFAGEDSGHLFLGDVTAPLRTRVFTAGLKEMPDFKINPDSYGHLFKNLKLSVKDSYYYLSDGSVPVIYRGRINDPMAKTVSYKQVYFNQLLPIDSTSFAFRTISAKTKSFSLGIIRIGNRPTVSMHPEILKKQTDGIFDSDGALIYLPHTKNIIYTYAYRNQFVVTDENLRVKNIQNTIDTTAVARVQAKTLSDGRTKMAAPPFTVNRRQTAIKGFLFNQSGLMGKNESPKRWKSSSTVDIYNTSDRQYAGSFYIPDQKENSMTDMLAVRDRLYILFGKELVCYRYRENLINALQK